MAETSRQVPVGSSPTRQGRASQPEASLAQARGNPAGEAWTARVVGRVIEPRKLTRGSRRRQGGGRERWEPGRRSSGRGGRLAEGRELPGAGGRPGARAPPVVLVHPGVGVLEQRRRARLGAQHAQQLRIRHVLRPSALPSRDPPLPDRPRGRLGLSHDDRSTGSSASPQHPEPYAARRTDTRDVVGDPAGRQLGRRQPQSAKADLEARTEALAVRTQPRDQDCSTSGLATTRTPEKVPYPARPRRPCAALCGHGPGGPSSAIKPVQGPGVGAWTGPTTGSRGG